MALTPQQLADLWYLKFGTEWVARSEMNQDWRNISRELMKNNLADYDLAHVYKDNVTKIGLEEIVKLKETCR